MRPRRANLEGPVREPLWRLWQIEDNQVEAEAKMNRCSKSKQIPELTSRHLNCESLRLQDSNHKRHWQSLFRR